MSKRRSERCFTYGGVIYFRFIILKCIVKKMLFCIKRSFVWLKKIVFDESFYEIVLLLIQFFSCTWLLLFLWAGRLCNVLPDWGCFFIHLMIFFQWFDEIQSRFFFVRFSVSCFFKKRKVFFLLICKKGFCWMNWIVCRMSCRRILFVVDSFFFLHVVASVLVGRKVVQCLIWFEVVFLFIWWFFFNDLMKYNHGFFLRCFFLWDFLSCFFNKRKVFFLLICKKGFCWMNWIVCRMRCRRICFFFWFQFFFMGLKKFQIMNNDRGRLILVA